MFSGIVETTVKVLNYKQSQQVVTLWVTRPDFFQDLKTGDSFSCNGICLTLEKFDEHSMQFSLAAETLKLLKIIPEKLLGQVWNIERSLRFGDRVHGHLVTGHVEALGEVIKAEALGESWLLKISVPPKLRSFIWPKGSIALNGVSLTVNQFSHDIIDVCLIPETLMRTNLKQLNAGDQICVETDYLAKAYFQGRDHGLS